MERRLESYLEESSTPLPPVLEWLERESHLRTNYGRMVAGPLIGRVLITISKMLSPTTILELGTFTGYSAICLAQGLKEGGALKTLEINDELEDLILEAFSRANLEKSIELYIGDALETMKSFAPESFDLIYIDANKRHYCSYYNSALSLLKRGGYIIADNVLWSGKLLLTPLPQDAQTQELERFNRVVKEDRRTENFILPLGDGLNIIRKL